MFSKHVTLHPFDCLHKNPYYEQGPNTKENFEFSIKVVSAKLAKNQKFYVWARSLSNI
jgi:hypothetical protein